MSHSEILEAGPDGLLALSSGALFMQVKICNIPVSISTADVPKIFAYVHLVAAKNRPSLGSKKTRVANRPKIVCFTPVPLITNYYTKSTFSKH